MSRPLIGICAAVERASFGPWVDEPATLLPRSYSTAVQRAGGIAMLLPPDPHVAESPGALDHLDALLLSGGADLDAGSHGAEPHSETAGTNPDRDRFELALARRAIERDLPLLGVCRGMQLLNVAAGGTLDQHLPESVGSERHRPVPGSFAEHSVRMEPGSLAARAAGAEHLKVKSHHHQGVRELGRGVVASGWSEQDGVVEAIELPGRRFALGVLWHPEEDPDDRVIPTLVRLTSERIGLT